MWYIYFLLIIPTGVVLLIFYDWAYLKGFEEGLHIGMDTYRRRCIYDAKQKDK